MLVLLIVADAAEAEGASARGAAVPKSRKASLTGRGNRRNRGQQRGAQGVPGGHQDESQLRRRVHEFGHHLSGVLGRHGRVGHWCRLPLGCAKVVRHAAPKLRVATRARGPSVRVATRMTLCKVCTHHALHHAPACGHAPCNVACVHTLQSRMRVATNQARTSAFVATNMRLLHADAACRCWPATCLR